MAAIQITITLNEKGEFNMTGPLENKMVMFGLLEIAKETVSQHNAKPASGIVAPPAGFMLPPGSRS